jgi:hypothetical protein
MLMTATTPLILLTNCCRESFHAVFHRHQFFIALLRLLLLSALRSWRGWECGERTTEGENEMVEIIRLQRKLASNTHHLQLRILSRRLRRLQSALRSYFLAAALWFRGDEESVNDTANTHHLLLARILRPRGRLPSASISSCSPSPGALRSACVSQRVEAAALWLGADDESEDGELID